MPPSLVVPNAHRLPGTGAVPSTAGSSPSASAGGWASWYGPGLYGRLTTHTHGSLPSPIPGYPSAGPSPWRQTSQAEGKFFNRGPHVDLPHGMNIY
jgi:hypothetical protein